jgi:predicted RNase H-like HicB family nuclease
MTTTEHYTAVFEHESNGTISAWIVGLTGVYASADSVTAAKAALLEALNAHLGALRELNQPTSPRSEVHVVRHRGQTLDYVGLGALLGKRTSRAKASAARANGQKGGRPRRVAVKSRRG